MANLRKMLNENIESKIKKSNLYFSSCYGNSINR
jgi:hypothetical protein